MHQGNFTVKRLHMYLCYIRIRNGQMNTTSTHTSLCFLSGDKFEYRPNSHKNNLYEWHLPFAEKSENKGYLHGHTLPV